MRFSTAALLALAASLCPAGAAGRDNLLAKPDAWFASPEGRAATANILSWHAPVGGWPKNIDTSQPFKGDPAKLKGTFDNGATTGELRFLARAFRATSDARYRQAVLDAASTTSSKPSTRPAAGRSPIRPASTITATSPSTTAPWSASWSSSATSPLPGLRLRRSARRKAAARQAFDRGIDCILKCQVIVNGKPTVWCAQHDEMDLRPRPARSYELASFSGGESAGILLLLMCLERPSPEVRRAIEAGAQWYESAKRSPAAVVKEGNGHKVVSDPAAPPLWARFYDIETGRPIFCRSRRHDEVRLGRDRRRAAQRLRLVWELGRSGRQRLPGLAGPQPAKELNPAVSTARRGSASRGERRLPLHLSPPL